MARKSKQKNGKVAPLDQSGLSRSVTVCAVLVAVLGCLMLSLLGIIQAQDNTLGGTPPVDFTAPDKEALQQTEQTVQTEQTEQPTSSLQAAIEAVAEVTLHPDTSSRASNRSGHSDADELAYLYRRTIQSQEHPHRAGYTYYALSETEFATGESRMGLLYKSVKLEPKLHLTYFDLGFYETYLTNVERGRQYQKAFSVSPSHSSSVYNFALAHKEDRLYDEAQTFFKRYLTLTPADYVGYTNTALCLKGLEDTEGAMHSYVKAMPLVPTHFQLYINIGSLMLPQTTHILEKALQPEMMQYANPFDLSVITFNYGLLQKRSDSFRQCQEMMTKSLSYDPKYSQAYYHLGNCQSSDGNHKEAEINYFISILLNPTNPKVYTAMADMLSYVGGETDNAKKDAQAKQNWRKTLTLEGHATTTYFDVALHMKTRGDYQEGLHFYKMFLHLKPNSCVTYLNMGNAHTEDVDGDFEEGVVMYQKGIHISPQFLRAYVTLANAMGEWQRGNAFWNIAHNFKLFHKAVSLSPVLKDNQHFQQYNQLGDLTRPKTSWQQALEQEKALVGLYAKGKLTLPPVISVSSTELDTYLNQANIMQDERDIHRMEDTYKKVMMVDSENAEAYSHIIYDFTLPLPLPWQDETKYAPEGASIPNSWEQLETSDNTSDTTQQQMHVALDDLMLMCDRQNQSAWLEEARTILQQQGLVILDKFLPEDLISEVRAIVKDMADKEGFDSNLNIAEAVKRQDFAVPLRGPVQQMFDEIITHLLPLFTEIFKQEGVFVLDSGVVISYPAARAQPFHRDVALVKLHPQFNYGAAKTYTIQIPLTQMTSDMGPLEVQPGTHYKTESNSAQPLQTLFDLGSITVYGTTLRHRGGLNNGNAWRPVFYFTFMGRGLSPMGLTYRIPSQHVGRFEEIGTPHIKYVGDTNMPE